MDKPLNYPLQQLVEIKQKRFDQAVIVLEQKKQALAQAEKTLNEVEAERDKVLLHKNDKLAQMRKELDEGTTSDKIEQMRAYLKVVQGRLAEKEKKVEAQKKVVDMAKKQIEAATQEMFLRKKDMEKLEMHRTEWEKEAKYWIESKEAIEHDDQGASAHILRKTEMKKREKNS